MSPENELERVGFILKDGSVIEVPNILSSEDEFQVAGQHIMEYVISGKAIATWHTHPKKDANLTIQDHEMFLRYPELDHYILGTDGLRKYYVRNGKVING